MNLRKPSALIGGVALLALAAPAALADPTTPTGATTTAVTSTTSTAEPSPVTTTATTAPPVTTTTQAPVTTTTQAPVTTSAPTPSTTTPSTTTTSTTTRTTDSSGGRLVPGGRATAFGPVAPRGVITDPSPEEAAAGYLARELAAGGHHFSVDFGGTLYPDYGVTADAVLALDAAGAGQTEAAAATRWLADNVVNYTGFGDPTEISAGSVAKLLNVAAAQGIDPTAFGGYDLVGTLRSLEQPSGQFRDTSKYGDYSNLFGQSLAVMGLERTGSNPSATSVSFLTAQQCTDGGFRLYFGVEPCASDPDATAMAVQALIAVNGASDPNAAKGLDYLTGRQQSNGGVGGGGPTSGVNANSTGLAGQAFLAGGRTAQARLANRFLANLQYDCAFPTALRGGVAYDAAAFAAQKAAGAGAKAADQDRRSTTQAILSLSGTPLYAVTAVGAVAGAPVVVCAAPTTSTTTTAPPTATTTTTTTSSSTTTTGSTEPAVTSSTTTDEPLAYTGAQALPLGGLALALLAGGVVLVVLARRRGTHA
jgi:hypothetical protein